MVTITAIDQCPTCQHSQFTTPFPARMKYDNSLGNFIRKSRYKTYSNLDMAQFLRNEWRVYNHCSLVFCLKRPSLVGEEEWYNQLFAKVENRKYDSNPLPQLYIKNQTSFAQEFFDILNQQDVFEGVQSIIHFRCHAGLLLHEIGRKKQIHELYGLEYFENPALHAEKLLGKGFIARMNGPEPTNPFQRQKFDLILLEHGLTHAHNPGRFLEYIKSLLNPRGKIIVYNEPDHAKGFRSPSYYGKEINFFHKQLYTRNTMLSFLQSRGLECTELVHPIGRCWTVANHSMLFVCILGKTHLPRQENTGAVVLLLKNWLKMHKKHKRKGVSGVIYQSLKRIRKRFLSPKKGKTSR